MTSRKPCFQIFLLCSAIALVASSAEVASADGPLVLDKATGHYKDLSYEALSVEGLSWKERVRLFGGETVHYAELTDEQRAAKEAELAELLRRIVIADRLIVHPPYEADRLEEIVRKWLDAQTQQIPSAYDGGDAERLRHAAVGFFRAYEIFGAEKYRDAGLKCADTILAKQWPKGHWPWGDYGEDFVRIQDGFFSGPFWVMLYAHKVSGDKKYFESARRAADVLLSLQRPGGGWGDQWRFSGQGTRRTGVVHGISFNDSATNDAFRMMVMMYHLTGDRKYIANLGKLGPWIAKANLGKGEVAGWCQQYHDDGRPARARPYEIDVPYTRVIPWHVGPLLTWLYLMDGDEAHIQLLKRAYATHERIRKEDLKYLADWKAIQEVWTDSPSYARLPYRPGLPDAYLPDASNWGPTPLGRMHPLMPLTSKQIREYGGYLHQDRPNVSAMGKLARAYQAPPGGGNIYGYSHTATKVGNGMFKVRRVLLEHKRGGREAVLRYYSHPTKYTPDQYLQARIDAARRVLDYRNRSLAVDWGDRPGSNSIGAWKDFRWVARKHKWYSRDAAFNTSGPFSGTVWYQWQFLYDNKLAHGKIDADAAARGGRGLEMYRNLDSWDVLGEWCMACHELENYFDVPIEKE
ncbi:MAG: hypothetical protein CMJ75_06620 [Planctomycetaceae bacterium]|nr:hypothetical protein [Planctomycetaceae bacterium]